MLYNDRSEMHDRKKTHTITSPMTSWDNFVYSWFLCEQDHLSFIVFHSIDGL